MTPRQVKIELDITGNALHDCAVWAFSINPETRRFILDIDFISKWISPAPGEHSNYHFDVAPSTLVFDNVYDLVLDISEYNLNASIDNISQNTMNHLRNGSVSNDIIHLWKICLNSGYIQFYSSGYHLICRSKPKRIQKQRLLISERNSFIEKIF